MKQKVRFKSVFFNCYLAAPKPTLDRSQGDSLTKLMLITAFYLCRPEDHLEPRSEVGSLSPAKRLAGFEPGTFQLLTLKFLKSLTNNEIEMFERNLFIYFIQGNIKLISPVIYLQFSI